MVCVDSNIVRAINFDPYADPPYLVMEYVPGISLRQLIQRGPLRADDAVAILSQVLSGLDHAHSHGIIHRDIKPENILIHRLTLEQGLPARVASGWLVATMPLAATAGGWPKARSGRSSQCDLGRRAEHAGEARHDGEDALPGAVGDVRVEPAPVEVARAL